MERLRLVREAKKLRQKDVAEVIGVSQVAYSYYETGFRKPDPETLTKLSEYFGVTTDYLLGIDSIPKRTTKKRWVPILGWIIAGPPVMSEENIIGYVEMTEDAFPNDELFSLIVEGDSMYPYYMDGDIAIYKVTSEAENGDDVAVRVNGDDDITISRALGHSSLEVTKRYLAFTSEDDRNFALRASPMDNRKRNRSM